MSHIPACCNLQCTYKCTCLDLPCRGFGIVHKWSGCAKYTIHHLGFSDVDPHWAYVAGLDSEVVCGRWDGGGATCSGNSNSSTGGHGRAAGPVKKRESKENEEDAAAHPKAGTGVWGPCCMSHVYCLCHRAHASDSSFQAYYLEPYLGFVKMVFFCRVFGLPTSTQKSRFGPAP
eukprot:scaffold36249_cov17-Tisochrysis_lutea.AAC.1